MSFDDFRRPVEFGGWHAFLRLRQLATYATKISSLETLPNTVSVLELRRLLVDLRSKRPDICFRYRLLGEMWVVQARRVAHVSERGVILNDANPNRYINLPDLDRVVQFEIDAPFQGFQPHCHYSVRPSVEFH